MEKSKRGIYCTDYDIKDQQRIFKAKQSKNEYIEKLGNKKLRKSPKRKVELNFNSLELGVFYNPRMSMDIVQIQQHSIADLYSDYLADPQKIIGYINLAKNLDISRAKKKIIQKFKLEIGRKKTHNIWPLRERIHILYQSLAKGQFYEKNSKK